MPNNDWYGQWGMVLISITIALWLIFSFLKPRKGNWKNSGILSAFIIALYTEMYGFPLTIYILSSVFGIDIGLGHLEGHLWSSLFGLGKAGALAEMFIGYLTMAIGGFLIIAGWKKIYRAKDDELVTNGIYKHIRHPQYTGIILVTFGMLVHWPTLITLLMWPVLVAAYYYLAKKEEKEIEKKFGDAYQEYKSRTPMFFPSFWRKLKQNHFLLMVLCCAIPVVLVIGFALFKSSASWAWLFILLCPLMHIFMMKGHKQKLYQCPECGFEYKEKQWAEKCEAWCKKYHTCNIEITSQAIKHYEEL